MMKLYFLIVILRGKTLSIIPIYLTGFLQSELKLLLRNSSMNYWESNDISLGMNSKYWEVQYTHGLAKLKSDPNLCELCKVAVECFKASEKLTSFSDESRDLQKAVDQGNEADQVNTVRNATRCNNRDSMLHLNFTLNISIFSQVYI